uniref:Uncharacterized protein n=1 Tax=Pseudomonas phage PaBG TaxID=1335230 RepID=S5VZQ5_9CAUD
MPLPCACGKPEPCYQSPPCTNLAVKSPTQPILGAKRLLSFDELVCRLTTEGGAIVNATSCSAYELTQAQVEGRVYVDAKGLAYVLLDADWLAQMRKLEKAHPHA